MSSRVNAALRSWTPVLLLVLEVKGRLEVVNKEDHDINTRS